MTILLRLVVVEAEVVEGEHSHNVSCYSSVGCGVENLMTEALVSHIDFAFARIVLVEVVREVRCPAAMDLVTNMVRCDG